MALCLYMNLNCSISEAAVELFKLYIGDVEIKGERVMSIGPDWDSLEYDE